MSTRTRASFYRSIYLFPYFERKNLRFRNVRWRKSFLTLKKGESVGWQEHERTGVLSSNETAFRRVTLNFCVEKYLPAAIGPPVAAFKASIRYRMKLFFLFFFIHTTKQDVTWCWYKNAIACSISTAKYNSPISTHLTNIYSFYSYTMNSCILHTDWL